MRRHALVALGCLGLSIVGCAANADDTDSTASELGSLPMCVAQSSCTGGAGPRLEGRTSWRHFSSRLIVLAGSANHRGRDQVVVAGTTPTIVGKFAYGLADKDLKDEDVDIFLQQGCGGDWAKLGTTRTTEEGAHSNVEGFEDDGGRVFYKLPRQLPVGRHRIQIGRAHV